MTPNPLIALLVEDDPSWQGILTEILNDYGLKVDCTDNSKAAIEMLRATPYRLAIVDLSLAGKDHHNQDGLRVFQEFHREVGLASHVEAIIQHTDDMRMSQRGQRPKFVCQSQVRLFRRVRNRVADKSLIGDGYYF